MTYLVDTDYVVDYLKGQRNVPEMLATLLPDGIAVSIITFAEVYEGIYYGQKPSYYARQFAILRGQLRVQPEGKTVVQPKDNYDLFIAATALQHNLTLVTRNVKDYERIPHLKLYN